MCQSLTLYGKYSIIFGDLKNRFREEIMSIILGLVSLIVAVAISIAATVFFEF